MIKKFFIASLLVSSAVAAEPVYLKCVQDDKEDRWFELKIDEAEGKVNHTWNNGVSFKAEAFFTANAIAYSNPLSDPDISKQSFEINRSSLRWTEINRIGGKVFPPREGQCEIVNVSGRKI
jgi:hypothetical protein